jgi:MraZ protein
MFLGEYPHSIDSKSRITIPSKLRSPLKDYCIDQFVVTRGFEPCLFMFAPNEWHQLNKQLSSFPLTNEKSRSLQRMFFSGAGIVDCDAQGRILVPKNLLDHAQISRDVIIIGASNRIEIWSPENYKKYVQDMISGSYAKIAEELTAFNFKES